MLERCFEKNDSELSKARQEQDHMEALVDEQRMMFERCLTANDSELCKIKQEQSHVTALVDEHNKRLSLLDAELLIDNPKCPDVEKIAPNMNRFRMNHERI